MRLAELQAFFYRSVRESSPPRGIEDVFAGRSGFGAVRRMGIYHSAYWARQQRTLGETFPSVAKLLGSDRFERLARDYLVQCPGRKAAIEYVGERFAGFLAERRGELPSLAPSLAELEWARTESLLAPDPKRVVCRDSLRGRNLSAARALFAAHVRILRSSRGALAYMAGDASGVPSPETTVCVVVWRREHAVRHSGFDDPEGVAIERAAAGVGFGEVCEAFGESAPIEMVATKIGAWVDRRWIEAFEEEALSDA